MDPTDPKTLLQRALAEVKDARDKLRAAERAQREPIAVIGIGCRFPGGADDPGELWRQLAAGVDATGPVPPERWDADALHDPDPDAPGKSYVRRGGFLRDVDRFAARFFRVSPREAERMDPQHRLLLEVAWAALEDAGVAPDRLRGTPAGVFVGITNNDYARRSRGLADDAAGLFHVSGTSFSFAAGRLAYVLGLHGPALAIDTACSSSLVALHLACHSLRAGECDLALVGGVNLMFAPEGFVLLSKARMLAPDGRCKTFSAAADGYARGEGCGVVVLRRLSDARAAADRIYAVVRGSAVNQDGASSGLTVPNGAAQRALIEQALRAAGLGPGAVGYVEAHGTGTALGDPIEARALGEALAAPRPAPLLCGSIKTNLGHLEAAAGVAGIIKTALVLHHGQIPASLHSTPPSPHIDFTGLGLAVPTALTTWPEGQPRVAGVSSFGASGTNAHAILSAPPAPAAPASASPTSPASASASPCLLPLSARSADELRALADRWDRHLAAAPPDEFAATCAAAASRRAHLEERLAIVAPDAAAARSALAAFAEGRAAGLVRGRVGARRPRVALLFSGQGAQYPGMARGLLASEPSFRATIERCDAALGDLLGARLLDLFDQGHPAAARIDSTALAQPALFALEVALANLLLDRGLEPWAALGHSVGELAAACVAGVLTLEDGLALVRARGLAMQALPAGGAMAAAFTDPETAAAALASDADTVALAAINAPDEVVLSGSSPALARVLARLHARGVRSRALQVSHAFHSPALDPMLPALEAAAARLHPAPPRFTLVSGLTGAPITAPDPAHWRRQAREPVRFAAAVTALARAGVDLFLEVGPHPVLLAAARRCAPDPHLHWLPTLRRGHDDRTQLLTAAAHLFVAGADLDVARLTPGPHHHLALPPSPFARERHWLADAPPPPAATPRPAAWLHATPLASPALAPATHAFEHTLQAAAAAVLRDHRVFGAVVLSGAVQAALMGTAAAAVFGPDVALEFTDVTFRAPLTLTGDAPRTVQVVLATRGPDSADVRLVSREGDAWIDHAVARVRAGGELPRARFDLAAARARCREQLTDDEFYRRGWPEGEHDLGPSFRSVAALWRRDGEALARVRLRDDGDDGDPADRPRVRACRLGEASGQVLAAALPDWDAHAETTAIGLAIDRSVDASHAAPPTVWWHAVVRDDTGGVIRGDVQLLDDDGQVLSRAEGLQLGRIHRDHLRRTLLHAARPARPARPVRAALAAAPPPARRELLIAHLRALIADACGGAPEAVPTDLSIRDLGVDSLLAMTLREHLQADLDLDLPIADLIAGPTLDALAARLDPPVPADISIIDRTTPVPADIFAGAAPGPALLRPAAAAPGPALLRPAGAGPIQLVCLPDAGGGASLFRDFAAALPTCTVHAVQLPGREDRIHEPPLRRLADAVALVLPAVLALDGPLVLLGHSLGALLAFELARALAHHRRTPALLAALAFPAPHRPQLVDTAGLLRRVGDRLDPALRDALTPVLTADIELVASHSHADAPPLACPIAAFGGADDPHVPRDALADWARHTRGDFTLRTLPGDHAFIRTAPAPLLAALAALLPAVRPGRPPT